MVSRCEFWTPTSNASAIGANVIEMFCAVFTESMMRCSLVASCCCALCKATVCVCVYDNVLLRSKAVQPS